MSEYVPCLRTDIEILPTYHQGERVFLVKDHLGLIQQPVLLHGEGLEILQFVDGRRNVRDIQYEIIRARQNTFVSMDVIQSLLAKLDEAYLLDSHRYREKRQEIVEEYSRQEVRMAFLAGKSYPEDREELCDYLGSFFPDIQDTEVVKIKKTSALVSPHIDLDVGKDIYVKAYNRVKSAAPERIILLGTGHSLHEHFFSLTQKDFETPLGRVKTHKRSVKALRKAGADLVSPDDFAHRSEHSLELQLLFLQHLFGCNFSIVPVLCGSLHQVLSSCARPSDIPGFNDFSDTLKRLREEVPNTLVVAGVDFSHIGPKFGHSWPATILLQEAKDHDARLIESVCRADIDSFWTEIQKVDNKYNVCGFSTMATLLELMPYAEGQLLGYDFWQEEATRSAVSFAAIALS